MARDLQTGHSVYVEGTVIISSAASGLPSGFGPGGDGIVLLHLVSRLVGLGDATVQGQVMSPQALTTGVTGLGAGDRAGLSRLGSKSGCLSVPANGGTHLGQPAEGGMWPTAARLDQIRGLKGDLPVTRRVANPGAGRTSAAPSPGCSDTAC